MQEFLTNALDRLNASVHDFRVGRVLSTDDDWVGLITGAVLIQSAGENVVRSVVQHARQSGATWQVIGDSLGVSRQAAFQRFGKPIDPRTGEPMNTTPLSGAAELAAIIIGDLSTGRWSRVTERFDATMRDGLSDDALAAAWAQVIGLSGAYEGHGEVEATRASDVTITNTPLSFEAGEFTARISLRDDLTIAGLHILAPGTP